MQAVDIAQICNYKEGEEIYGYIYITTFPNKKVYVGQSTLKINSWKEKNYFGSGTIFYKALKHFKREQLKKRIVRLCYSFEEYNLWEARFIQITKSCDIKYGYNVLPGSANGKQLSPCEVIAICNKMAATKKGKNTGSDNPNYGNGDKIKGNKNPMYEYQWSEKQLKQMSESLKAFNQTEDGQIKIKNRKEKLKGRFYINNGIETKVVTFKDFRKKYKPLGFKKGSLISFF